MSESQTFLGLTIGMETASDTLSELADQLGRLPLAISQAGSYMVRHQVSPLEYMSIYDKTRKDLLDFKGQDVFDSSSIETTLLLSKDRLERELHRQCRPCFY